MPKVWRFPPYDEAVVQRLAGDLKKPVLIAQVLAARGFENGDQANEFLSARLVDLHEPELLPRPGDGSRSTATMTLME
jgi:hypothetical protein